MAIAFVAATSAAGSTTTSTSVAITSPTGSVGDLLLFGIAAATPATTGAGPPSVSSTPSGLTPIFYNEQAWNFTGMYYRFVQSGDPTSYTFSFPAGSALTTVAVRYSGVSSTTPFRNWNTHGMLDPGATTASSITFPALDNVQSTDQVVALAAMGVSTKTTSISTISTPSGWTSRVSKNGPTSSTTYPVTAEFFDKLAGTDTPSVSGSTGQYIVQSVALIAASNPVTDAIGSGITFVNASTAKTTSTGATSLSVSLPTGVANGDLLLLVAGTTSGTVTFGPPTGWQQIQESLGYHNSGTSSFTIDIAAKVWYKVASSEGSSYTVTFNSGGTEYFLAVAAYRGLRSPYPIKLHGGTCSTANGTTSVAPYALPQVSSDNLIVNIYTFGGDSTGTITTTGPSGTWTQRAQVLSSVSSDFNGSITIADKLGATDQPTATASPTGCWGVFSISLVGAPAFNPSIDIYRQAVQRASSY